MENDDLKQYKLIDGDWKYKYYISRFGSVVRDSFTDSHGRLVPRVVLNYILPNKCATVKLVNREGLDRKLNVASLVLKYFGGINVEDNKNIVYLDGNRYNCIFENLKYIDDRDSNIKKIDNSISSSNLHKASSSKYSNIVVYFGENIVSYFNNTSEAANELFNVLGISRDTVVSSIGKSIKGNKLYHQLKFTCVSDDEFNNIISNYSKNSLVDFLDKKENISEDKKEIISEDKKEIISEDKKEIISVNTDIIDESNKQDNNISSNILDNNLDNIDSIVSKIKNDLKREIIDEVLDVLCSKLDLKVIKEFNKDKIKEESIKKDSADKNKKDSADKNKKDSFINNTINKAKRDSLFDDIDKDEAYAQFERDMFKDKFYETYKRMYGVDIRKKQ